MPIPDAHRRKLDAGLTAHEERLKSLESEIEAAEAEATLHRMILHLGRNERLLSALGDLHDDPALAREASSDPKAFFRARRVEVPAGAAVRIEPDGAAVVGEFKHRGLKFAAEWRRAAGFAVTPLEDS